MLRAKALHDVLKTALTAGVETALLVTTAGGVIATAHVDPSFARSKDHALLVAVVANVWRNYSVNDCTISANDSRNARRDGPGGAGGERRPENLEFVLIDIGRRRMCLLDVGGGGAVLCVAADTSVECGLLKLKAASIHGVLDSQLRAVPLSVAPERPAQHR